MQRRGVRSGWTGPALRVDNGLNEFDNALLSGGHVELGAHLGEAVIDLREPLIYAREPLIHPPKAVIHVLAQRVEAGDSGLPEVAEFATDLVDVAISNVTRSSAGRWATSWRQPTPSSNR